MAKYHKVYAELEQTISRLKHSHRLSNREMLLILAHMLTEWLADEIYGPGAYDDDEIRQYIANNAWEMLSKVAKPDMSTGDVLTGLAASITALLDTI